MNNPIIRLKTDNVKVPIDLYLELRREMQNKINFRDVLICYLIGGIVGETILYLIK
jgi:hypothetical protein